MTKLPERGIGPGAPGPARPLGGAASEARPASPDGADRFRAALGDRAADKVSERTGERRLEARRDPAAGDNPMAPGTAILGMLGATPGESVTPAEGARPAWAPDLNQIVQAVAERILVSDAARDGSRAVRLVLREDTLPGTEIQIGRHDGQLVITLETDSAVSHEVLADRLDDFRERLTARFGADVRVELTSRSGEQPGDDRSRQRRELRDEQER